MTSASKFYLRKKNVLINTNIRFYDFSTDDLDLRKKFILIIVFVRVLTKQYKYNTYVTT